MLKPISGSLSLPEIPYNQQKSPKIGKISNLSNFKRSKHGDILISQLTHGTTTTRYNLYQDLGILDAFKSISGSF